MRYYYGCLLAFVTETGYGSANEDSTTSLIFVAINLMTLGIIGKSLDLDVRDIPLLFSLLTFIIFFVISYKYFKKESVKFLITSRIQRLGRLEKIILYAFCFIYTILIPILFIKSYA